MIHVFLIPVELSVDKMLVLLYASFIGQTITALKAVIHDTITKYF